MQMPSKDRKAQDLTAGCSVIHFE